MGATRSLTRKLMSWPLLFLFAGLIYIGCTTGIVPATGEKRYLGFSWQEEVKIGQEASKEIASLFGIYQDAKLERYVEEVGQRVLAVSHLRRPGIDEEIRRTPVTFRVLDSPIINAMALPGGYIYVTRGMMAHLNNEDQLASVLAHEIGHVSARHAARQAWQQRLGQGLLLGGALLGQGLGLPADQILNIAGMAAQLIFLRYSREDELEADRLSVEYCSLAGYDAEKVTGFFRTLARIEEKEGQGLPNFLSTHPNPGNRIEQITQLAAKWRPQRAPAPVDSDRYVAATNGLVVGEDPRQGFVEGSIFYHPDLRFRFPVPRGFKVINQPTQVMMVESQNRAIMGFTSTGEKSLQSAVSKFLSQPGLKVIDRGGTRSGGLPAFFVIADAQMQKGQVVRLLAYFVEYRGTVYHFIGYTSPQLFGSLRSVFLQTMQGFSELDDPAILNRKPARLRIIRAPESASFRTFIPRDLPAGMKPEDIAILNQIALDERIERGRPLKIPVVS
jgi:predicted Zn-dependent protease